MKERNIKISYMKVMHNEWLKLYPKSPHSAANLQIRIFIYQKQKNIAQKKKEVATKVPKDARKEAKLCGKTEWTPAMLCDLEKCYNKATKIKGDTICSNKSGSKVSYMNVMLNKWKKLYPGSTLSEYSLYARLWKFQMEKTSECNVDSGDCKSENDSPSELKKETRQTHKNLTVPVFLPKDCDNIEPEE